MQGSPEDQKIPRLKSVKRPAPVLVYHLYFSSPVTEAGKEAAERTNSGSQAATALPGRASAT